jgi:hypothetical protein
MTRHQRLQKTLRNPQRKARQWRNREGRRVRRLIREGIAEHFADGHVHTDRGVCPQDQAMTP